MSWEECYRGSPLEGVLSEEHVGGGVLSGVQVGGGVLWGEHSVLSGALTTSIGARGRPLGSSSECPVEMDHREPP